jgi:hypothetical protein
VTVHADPAVVSAMGEIKTDLDVWSAYDAKTAAPADPWRTHRLLRVPFACGGCPRLVTIFVCGHAPTLASSAQTEVLGAFISVWTCVFAAPNQESHPIRVANCAIRSHRVAMERHCQG